MSEYTAGEDHGRTPVGPFKCGDCRRSFEVLTSAIACCAPVDRDAVAAEDETTGTEYRG